MIIGTIEVKRKEDYMDLDTAAKICAYTCKGSYSQTYRMSAVLKNRVRPSYLQQAVNDLRFRFPSFYVSLANGFFWKKLKRKWNQTVEREDEICKPIDVTDGKPLFRVTYSDFRISLEIFHGVTDGKGAITFLKALLARYFNLIGIYVPETDGVLDISQKPKQEELEDSFIANYKPGTGRLPRYENAAYQYKINEFDSKLNIYQGRLSVSQLKEQCKKHNCKIAEYLTAAYIYSLYQNIPVSERSKPIKVQVPINLRPYYNSETLRNFSGFVNVGIDPTEREYDFETILFTVREQIRKGTDLQRIQGFINANVADAENVVSKYAPSVLKDPVLKLGFKLYGERQLTSPMSNIGIVDVPDSMRDQIEYFYSVIGKTHLNTIYSTVLTFGDTMAITFSTHDKKSNVPGIFFDFIRNNGVSVCSNIV